MGEHDPPRYVTNAELKQAIDDLEEKVPTRWEVRFLILAGLIASQLVPAQDIAHTAIRALP